MVSSADLIVVIAEKLKQYKAKNIVVDPVMVATSGAKLLQDDAVQALTVYGKYLEPDMEEETEAYRVSDDAMGDG